MLLGEREDARRFDADDRHSLPRQACETRRSSPARRGRQRRDAPWRWRPVRSIDRRSARPRHPAISSNSTAAMPTPGSVNVVNESASIATRPSDPGRGAPPARIPPQQRASVESWQRPLAGVTPSARSISARDPGSDVTRFESGANIDPSRLSRRAAAKNRARVERRGSPDTERETRSSCDAMSTPSGHSLLHALHSRHRSRMSCSRSSPSAAVGSGCDSA